MIQRVRTRFATAILITTLSAMSALAQAAPPSTPNPAAQAVRTVRIVLVGDSTVNAEGGWGKGFCDLMTPNVTCINDALNGRSSKSFIDEGAWAKALADKGDYYLIQFGHNDMKGKGPERETDPETTYAANIRRYIRDARAIEAEALGENVLVILGQGGGEVLPGSGQIGKFEVHELDFVVLDHFADVGGGFGFGHGNLG